MKEGLKSTFRSAREGIRAHAYKKANSQEGKTWSVLLTEGLQSNAR